MKAEPTIIKSVLELAATGQVLTTSRDSSSTNPAELVMWIQAFKAVTSNDIEISETNESVCCK